MGPIACNRKMSLFPRTYLVSCAVSPVSADPVLSQLTEVSPPILTLYIWTHLEPSNCPSIENQSSVQVKFLDALLSLGVISFLVILMDFDHWSTFCAQK